MWGGCRKVRKVGGGGKLDPCSVRVASTNILTKQCHSQHPRATLLSLPVTALLPPAPQPCPLRSSSTASQSCNMSQTCRHGSLQQCLRAGWGEGTWPSPCLVGMNSTEHTVHFAKSHPSTLLHLPLAVLLPAPQPLSRQEQQHCQSVLRQVSELEAWLTASLSWRAVHAMTLKRHLARVRMA